MIEEIQFQVTPEQALDNLFLQKKIKTDLGLKSDDFSFQSLHLMQTSIQKMCQHPKK
jgi:hypothetical protein